MKIRVFCTRIHEAITSTRCWIRFYRLVTASRDENDWDEPSIEILQQNDQYRDRLLEPEIDLLIKLTNALRLSTYQRHQFFLHFCRLDWTRRSTVNPKQLYLYCNIRRTRFAEALFVTKHKTGTRKASGRFDIIQLLSILFSIGTLTPTQIVNGALDKMGDDPVVLKQMADRDKRKAKTPDLVDSQEFKCAEFPDGITSKVLLDQIFQLFVFVYGTLNENEKQLHSLLQEFYAPAPTSPAAGINFVQVHRIRDIRDVLYKFPVLIYPAFWLQRTLCRRIVGEKFWDHLRSRRNDLRPLGLDQPFVTSADILAADEIETKSKPGVDEKKRNRTRKNSFASDAILPAEGQMLPTTTEATPVQSPTSDLHDLDVETKDLELLHGFSNIEEAWQVTADNLIASIYTRNLVISTPTKAWTVQELSKEYDRIAGALLQGKMKKKDSESVRKSIVKTYGYQFATFVYDLSHVAHHTRRSDEQKIVKRYNKAAEGGNKLKRDVKHIKEMYDPRQKRHFYYDFRTGESTWDKPLELMSV